MITGDIGTGKTLLIQTLFAELADRPLATARLAAANLDAQGVLPMVASAFGRPYEGRGKAALMQDLEATLLEDPAYREGALLVVDEAQTFSPEALEELRILSNFECNGRALMQIFLVGQTELKRLLTDPSMAQLRQRVIASHHLEPLDAQETRDYISHRLETAEWMDDPSFEPGVFEAVHRWSGGVPRRINWVMDRLLLYGYLEELRHLGEEELRTVLQELEAEVDTETPTESAATAPQHDEKPFQELEERVAALERAFRVILDGYRRRFSSTPPPNGGAGHAQSATQAVSRVAGRIAALEEALDAAVMEELSGSEADAEPALQSQKAWWGSTHSE